MTHTSPGAPIVRDRVGPRASSGIGQPGRSVQGSVSSGGGIWPRKGDTPLSLRRSTQAARGTRGDLGRRLSDSVRSVVGVGSDPLSPRSRLDPLSRVDSLLVNDVPLQRRHTGRWDSLDYLLRRLGDGLQDVLHIWTVDSGHVWLRGGESSASVLEDLLDGWDPDWRDSVPGGLSSDAPVVDGRQELEEPSGVLVELDPRGELVGLWFERHLAGGPEDGH
jgi:hypothetical protein